MKIWFLLLSLTIFNFPCWADYYLAKSKGITLILQGEEVADSVMVTKVWGGLMLYSCSEMSPCYYPKLLFYPSVQRIEESQLPSYAAQIVMNGSTKMQSDPFKEDCCGDFSYQSLTKGMGSAPGIKILSSLPALDDRLLQGHADACSGFIDDDGGLGPLGRVIAQKIRREPYRKQFLVKGPSDVVSFCPNFSNLSDAQKEHFWSWIFAAIAKEESSCDAGTVAKGVNGQAVGLMQLEASVTRRSWRGPDCEVPSIKPASANLKCAVEIMNELIKTDGIYSSQGKLFSSNSYWQELRKKDGTLKRAIQGYPLCKTHQKKI